MSESLFSGLEGFGFKNIGDLNLFADENSKSSENGEEKSPEETEKDFIFERTIECPCCNMKFKSKAIKNSKTRLLGTDPDLRPRYSVVDATKYEVISCTNCGYTATTRLFANILPSQKKLIKERITPNYKHKNNTAETVSYDDAIEMYKLALLNSVVKEAKASEKAYICLKTSWMLRGKAEEIGESHPDYAEIKKTEQEFTKNAYEGFYLAVSKESFPMCGMDEYTVTYLLARLALMTGNVDVSAKEVSKLLASKYANKRIKDRAYDLKQEILETKKQNKQ